MGAKTWMVVYSKGRPADLFKSKPVLDRDATLAFAARMFPDEKLLELEDTDLCWTSPRDNEIVVGCFPGLTVLAASEIGIDHPSRLPEKFLGALPGHAVYLHAMHSVVDWFAFGIWKDGTLQRALSVSPDNGVIEEIGARLEFEEPFWAGTFPAVDEDEDPSSYPLNFHPLDMGEAALMDMFGYHLEGEIDPAALDPETVPLMRFRRKKKSWWRFG
jgi:hypothetical protein